MIGFVDPAMFGVKYDEPMELYHNSGAIGSSKLGDFLACEELFRGRYVTGKIPKLAQTPAMRVGSAAHCYRLDGPHRYRSTYAIKPEDMSFATKEGKLWRQSQGTREILSFDEDRQARGVALALRQNSIGRNILRNGRPEVTFRMHAQRWGLPLQCRIDWMQGTSLKDLSIWDLKKTASIDTWARNVLNYGYHRQAALYQWITMQMAGLEFQPEFTFVVVEDEPPHRVQLFRLSDDYLTLGFAEIDEGLDRLSKRLKHGGWKRDNLEIQILNVPAWKAQQQAVGA